MLTSRSSMRSFATLLSLTLCCFAVPYASEQGANDGFILFTTDRDNPDIAGTCDRCEDIYVMSPDGTNPVRLTWGGGAKTNPAAYNSGMADWSHSKKLIAFQSDRVDQVPQIHLMNLDGSEQQLLVSLPGGAAFPSFSHSGNELCFHGQAAPRDIYIMNVHGTGLTNLTAPYREPGPHGEPPLLIGDSIRCDWSPKGNAIAFTNNRNGNQEIYVIDADGTGLRRLTEVAGRDANPAFSPKGDLIAFESNRDGRSEIYVMNADGTGPQRLTDFSSEPTPDFPVVTKPTWSPKGDRIAFHRRVGPHEDTGHFEVYTMNADGTNVTRITFTTPSPGFSGFPTWGKGWADSIGQ